MMRPPPKKRIDTQAVSTPLAAVTAAFAGLDIPVVSDTPQVYNPAPLTKPDAPKMGRVVLRRERAHRGGKTVIIVDAFAPHHSPDYIEELARKLRTACGCGGTVRGRAIEVQGDQPTRIRVALEAEGFIVAGVR